MSATAWPDARLQRLSDLLRLKAEAYDRRDEAEGRRLSREIEIAKKEAKDGTGNPYDCRE